ncbi:hypothetical protein TSUD_217170 [Trifolium subterraneum]|uniref:Uncharacterized protein n=1 Tax=Trifolium subterraneum TaxID=3900 RepID=A0A2Z6NWJ1_TRISU|nr:hypothetical protein TSUD_217170 [Trifolium subterraneum]
MVGLSSTETPIPELQLLAEATQIGEPASSSAEVRQAASRPPKGSGHASLEHLPTVGCLTFFGHFSALPEWMQGG